MSHLEEMNEFYQARIEKLEEENKLLQQERKLLVKYATHIDYLKEIAIFTAALANKELSPEASAMLSISAARKCREDRDWFDETTYIVLEDLAHDLFNF